MKKVDANVQNYLKTYPPFRKDRFDNSEIFVTEADFAAERQLWTQNCASSTKTTLLSGLHKNASTAKCQAAFDNATSDLRFNKHSDNYESKERLLSASMEGNTQLIIYALIVVLIGLLIYFYL